MPRGWKSTPQRRRRRTFRTDGQTRQLRPGSHPTSCCQTSSTCSAMRCAALRKITRRYCLPFITLGRPEESAGPATATFLSRNPGACTVGLFPVASEVRRRFRPRWRYTPSVTRARITPASVGVSAAPCGGCSLAHFGEVSMRPPKALISARPRHTNPPPRKTGPRKRGEPCMKIIFAASASLTPHLRSRSRCQSLLSVRGRFSPPSSRNSRHVVPYVQSMVIVPMPVCLLLSGLGLHA